MKPAFRPDAISGNSKKKAQTAAASFEDNCTPSGYAQTLFASLGLEWQLPLTDQRQTGELWAQSGAMFLSGYANEPGRMCPAPLAACAQGAWLALDALVNEKECNQFDAHLLLGERAAIAGLSRQGRVSPGGACQLLEAADGMLALNLPREDDYELLPAWLNGELTDPAELSAILKRHKLDDLIERGRLLGLAVAPMSPPEICTNWFHAKKIHPPVNRKRKTPLVIDLSALWAGPLCTQLLSECGARVIKVESVSRPDGARSGPAEFYNLMNTGKQSVALDLTTFEGRQQLRRLLTVADIVVESSRPRALEQMGIQAEELLAENPGMVWLSVTGYGRRSPQRDWIAYGDDVGVACGLSWLMGGLQGDPVFCGDAIADPLTGLHGAFLALASWLNGGGQLLDISLHSVVAHCISVGNVAPVEGGQQLDVARPVARKPRGIASALGADTDSVLGEFL